MNKFLTLLILICLSPVLILAQSYQITGKVTDSKDGAPLPGVTIQSQNKASVISNNNGEYTIKVNKGDVLTFSFVGMLSKSVKIESDKKINVSLSENEVVLNDVVVVGYGTMRKRDLSGAIDQIKGSDILKGNPSSSINQALQGRFAGVTVNQSDGAPGAGVSIQIRGINSFTTETQPLYIVDGIPFDVGTTPKSNDINLGNEQSSNPLSSINPNDIESIEVLKDASATAIYGSRGANGVILISTKKGQLGKDKIEFTSNFNVSLLGKKIDVLDASTYASYVNEQITNSNYYEGKNLTYPYSGKWSYQYDAEGKKILTSGVYIPSPEDYKNTGIRTDEYGNETLVPATNWQEQIFQTGISQEYNLRLSGANEKGWHSISGNYLDQQGIIKKSGFKRFTFRSNLGRKLSQRLEISANVNYSNSTNDFARTNAHDFSIIRSALLFPPTYPLDITPEQSDEYVWLAVNPLMSLTYSKDQTKQDQLSISSYADIKISNNLKFRQNIGLGYVNNTRGTYYGVHTGEGKMPTNGRAGQSDSWRQSTTAESILTFNKLFNKTHSVNVVGGFTYEDVNYGGKSMSATNFPTDITEEYDMSQGLSPGVLKSSKGQTKLVSLLSRVNYGYKDKYLLTASYRRDGSSKFVEGNKFANFASAALAWRLSEEDFIKRLNIFDNLKLRTSYGQTGNQGISAYQTMAYMSVYNYPFGGNMVSGYAQNTYRGALNPNLKWETTNQYNAGLDLSVFKNRVNFTVDYYWKKTIDLLQNVKVPSSSGFVSMWMNSGNVTNEGLEITGKFLVVDYKSFKWNLIANISFNKNTIGGLAGDQYATRLWDSADNIFIQRNGCPIGAIFGYVEDGLYDNEAEVRANPIYTNESKEIVKRAIGDIKYRDIDGQVGITENDRVIIGDVNPDYTFGITNEFNWKGFSFSFFIQGVQGNDIFNGNLLNVTMSSRGNIPTSAYNSRWTETNRENAKWPKAISSYYREWKISNRFIEDGSYVKLKNINFGYDFKNLVKGIDNLQVFASASNLLTLTKYSWYDPDVNAFGGDASRRGVDNYSYPSSRTFSLGLKVNF